MKRSIVSSIALTGVLLIAASDRSFAVAAVGTYDENGTQTNTVNSSATFASGTGGATAANVQSFATFDPVVEERFLLGTGGVLNFDSQINVGDQLTTTGIVTPVNLTFNAGAKSFGLGFALGSGLGIRQGNLSNRTPISAGNGTIPGFAFTTVSETPGALTLSIGAVSGGLPAEAVTQFGFTFLSRTSRNYGTVSSIATFSGGGTATSSVNLSTAPGAGVNDTFFGFIAPTGQSISSVVLTPGNDVGFSIDDVGFVSSVVPEPGSITLLLGGIALLGLRRRR